jgi:hypothetical protein
MTDRPYTDADLRAEAARQHKQLTEDPDFMGIGESMEGADIASTVPADGGHGRQWDDLPDNDFDAAQRAIDDLISGAADVSAWAVTLGAAGLQPVADFGIRLAGDGYPLAVQIAVDPDITDAAREELVAALTEVISATGARVLGCKSVN